MRLCEKYGTQSRKDATRIDKPKKYIDMKTYIKAAAALFTITLLTINISAQTPPPPNGNGGAPSGGNTPVGGGAPIAGGIGILLALGAAYGGKKVWDYFKKPGADF